MNPEPEPFEAEQLAQRSRHRSDHGSEEPEAARTGVPTSARALAALASAGTVGWVTASALAPGSIAPAAAGTFAAVLVAVLPRIGWLTAALALGGVASIQGRPGVALLVGLATIALVPLLPRGGASWPLPAGAVVLGVLGLAGAWPAVAARLGGPWRRAVLGAAGWLWLVLAAPIHGDGLYLAVPRATPTVGRWSSSLSGTIDLVLRPLVSSGTLMAAPVWALAALVLPWIVRGRSPAVAIVLVTAWAAALVSATISAVQLVHPGDLALATGTAVLGAIAGGLVALAPVLARATRARA